MGDNLTLTATSPSVPHPRCELYPDTPGHCGTLVACKYTACALSIAGSFCTLAIIVLFKKYREFTQRLIANLSLAAMLSAITYIMSDFSARTDGLCVFQGAAITYILWVIQLLALVILASLYLALVWQIHVDRLEKYLIIACWIVPLLFAGLPFSEDVYGPAGAWCWMKNRWQWRFGIWYIWKFVCDLVFFVAIIRIWCVLLRKQEGTAPSDRRDIDEDIKTLRVYPVVYFLTFLLPTINRVFNAADRLDGQTGYNFPLLLLQTITAPLFGALVALTFALDARTRQTLRKRGIVMEIRKKWSRSGRPKSYEPRAGIENLDATNTD